MLIRLPCAYCGTTESPRTRGHVFPRSIYPDTLPTARRITVPECEKCKALWEDAEPHFRNVLVAIWHPESPLADSRAEKLWRSFEKGDGYRRVHDLAALFRSTEVAGRVRSKIYPAEDERFNLILRRIVRGLAHEHCLGTRIADSHVDCDVMKWIMPPAFEEEMTWHTIAPKFISYGYMKLDDEFAHSFWIVRFSEHIEFYGRIRSLASDA